MYYKQVTQKEEKEYKYALEPKIGTMFTIGKQLYVINDVCDDAVIIHALDDEHVVICVSLLRWKDFEKYTLEYEIN